VIGGPGRAVLVDVGGVLLGGGPDPLISWSARLGISPRSLRDAVFGGCDDQVLIGATGEDDWWQVIGGRLGAGADLLDGLRRDMSDGGTWDADLLDCLRRLRGQARTALVSNCWPHMRARLAADGVAGIVDEIVLSCETGYAKPDPRIYAEALRRLRVAPVDAIFIDDTAGHVAAAVSLGLAGHRHLTTSATIAAIDGFVAARR